MQSKVWIGVFALAGCTLFAVAQDDVAPSSGASSDAAQTAAANAVVTSDGVDDSAVGSRRSVVLKKSPLTHLSKR
jgi:hypothetical protein